MIDLETTEETMRPVFIGRHYVGEIAEREWLFIISHVQADGAIWEAQLKNLVRVVARLMGFGFLSVPIGIFWTAAMLGWIGKPVTVGGFQGHVGALLEQPALLAAAVALGVGSMMALGLKLGYVNYFAKARSALLKDRLEIEEPGQCTVR
ncbi:MAG TPA: hypothetical protein VLV87_09860 [Gammaproteobacteria bacterium]|nr:hypothetical protein [Gammaproteobacteria bacterium]